MRRFLDCLQGVVQASCARSDSLAHGLLDLLFAIVLRTDVDLGGKSSSNRLLYPCSGCGDCLAGCGGTHRNSPLDLPSSVIGNSPTSSLLHMRTPIQTVLSSAFACPPPFPESILAKSLFRIECWGMPDKMPI